MVGVYLPKSIDQVVTFLAVLKAGAVAIIFDTQYPFQKIRNILAEYSIPFCISSSKRSLTLTPPEKDFKELFVENIKDAGNVESTVKRDKKVGFEDTAIIIFTSGSTGKPKGVCITHRNIFERSKGEIKSFSIKEDDRILNVLPLSFDVGLNQLLTSVMAGATLFLHRVVFSKDLLDVLKNEKITGISGVPTLWEKIIYSNLSIEYSQLRYLTISGGSISEENIEKLKNIFPDTVFIKTYGQTETFRSLIHKSTLEGFANNSLGKPVKNVELLLINEKGEECKTGDLGELVHSGVGVMSGYLCDAQYPKSDRIHTGDLVSKDKDGNYFYHGRKDKMIKISGYRIFPGEIEAILEKMDGIKKAVIVFFNNTGPSLIGFIQKEIIQKKESLQEKDIIDFAKKYFPLFMVPAEIYFVSEFPLSPHGKVDENILLNSLSQHS